MVIYGLGFSCAGDVSYGLPAPNLVFECEAYMAYSKAS